MKTPKHFLSIAILIATFTTNVFSQDYLDKDNRYMKLTEVSTDKTYGYNINNPVKVGSEEKAIGAYLNSLKAPDGDKIHIGDMKFNINNKFGLTYCALIHEKRKDTTFIYFNTNTFVQPKAIDGFTFKTIDDLPKVVVYPDDSIVKVKTCSDTVYSVDDFLITEYIGEKPFPTKGPAFTKGLDNLKKYFKANPLTDNNAAQRVFKVSIAFIVTCDGKAGNFQIISKGTGNLETYANQVLAIVNKMPQNWQPATYKGKKVDCYQVLSFTVINGQLDKVTYM